MPPYTRSDRPDPEPDRIAPWIAKAVRRYPEHMPAERVAMKLGVQSEQVRKIRGTHR
jgi:hypothetical protein